MKLKGKNCLITGASQGLGKAIAGHFLREGANAVICARGEKELFATRDELAKQFPSQKVLAKTCDVANEAQVNELVAFALHELGSLEALEQKLAAQEELLGISLEAHPLELAAEIVVNAAQKMLGAMARRISGMDNSGWARAS